MRVAVHYHSSHDEAARTLEEIRERGGDAALMNANLNERAEARGLVDRCVAEFGGLDLLVASAANFERMPIDAIDDEAWDRALSLNLTSQFVLARHAVPALRARRGAIVFITCTSATVPFRNYLPYVVSKGALRHLMKTLALELAPDIRVNAVAPGTVLPAEGMAPELVERLASRIPLQQLGSARDVADAVLYLTEAPFVTGQELIVDGGRTLAARERG
jgi:pteridine reductase